MTGPDAKLGKLRERSAEAGARRALRRFDQLVAACESPIESLLMGAICGRGLPQDVSQEHYCRGWDLGKANWTPGRFPKAQAYLEVEFLDAYLFLQCPLTLGKREVRLDAAICVDGVTPCWLAIECDGHDFHERTKEQAKADRSRDRALTAKGWHVVRFTGSELFSNADGCVEELVNVLCSMGGAT